jgi:hypothetical protein
MCRQNKQSEARQADMHNRQGRRLEGAQEMDNEILLGIGRISMNQQLTDTPFQ